MKLAEEHRRGVETFKELQMKHKRFVRADTKKFEEVWAMHEELVAAKVRRVLDADRVIHEQQLGVALAPAQRRRLPQAGRPRVGGGARSARLPPPPPLPPPRRRSRTTKPKPTPTTTPPSRTRPRRERRRTETLRRRLRRNPFPKRLGDPAHAELLEITAEACSFLVDPATSRALAEAEARARAAAARRRRRRHRRRRRAAPRGERFARAGRTRRALVRQLRGGHDHGRLEL